MLYHDARVVVDEHALEAQRPVGGQLHVGQVGNGVILICDSQLEATASLTPAYPSPAYLSPGAHMPSPTSHQRRT